jgi:nucleoside-diphosphate-sugar epimerase
MSECQFLVTGGQGCIGAWVVRNLVQAGLPTVVFDIDATRRRMAACMTAEEISAVTVVRGDVTDGPGVAKVIEDFAITHVIHLAAVLVPTCRADPARAARVNVVGSLNVFEAAKRCAGQVEQIVYASSAAALGTEEAHEIVPIPDDAPLAPTTHYGVFKMCNEWNARAYWRNDRVSSIGLRPGVVYGPGRDRGSSSALTEAMRAAIAGQAFHVDFGGVVNTHFVDDVAKVFVACSTAPHRGASVFNLRGIMVSVSDFVAEVERQVPSARGLITHSQRLISAPPVDDTGLSELLNDIPVTALSDGIARTLEVLRL